MHRVFGLGPVMSFILYGFTILTFRVFLFRMWAKFCNFVRAVICYNAAKFAISCNMTKQNRNFLSSTSHIFSVKMQK